MKSVNCKLKMLPAVVAVGVMAVAGAASAQTVVSGGGTLAQQMYQMGIFDAHLVSGTWSYTGTGSGAGKAAFLTNNPQATPGAFFLDPTGTPWPTTQGVHIVGSDSALTSAELSAYNAPTNVKGKSAYGPMIQVPAVATPVLLGYKEAGISTLNLTNQEICKIFSFDPSARNWSQVTTAADDGGVGSTNPISVVYRAETSGTTELLASFLNKACGSFLPAGKSFTFSNSFKTVVASALPTLTAAEDANGDGIPDVWVAATGNGGVKTALTAAHRFGYVSPDPDYTGSTNSNVARINTFLPTPASIQAALPAPPTGLARNTQTNWVPAYSLPTGAYPIYGTTNLLLGQCYAAGVGAGTPGGAAKELLTKFNDGTYDTVISDHNFVKLPTAWNNAINAAFLTSTSSLAIGNASVCGSIGRPS